jgi:hypothetical protein
MKVLHTKKRIIVGMYIEEVLVVRRDLQEDILRAYRFKPEVLPEEDGSFFKRS